MLVKRILLTLAFASIPSLTAIAGYLWGFVGFWLFIFTVALGVLGWTCPLFNEDFDA